MENKNCLWQLLQELEALLTLEQTLKNKYGLYYIGCLADNKKEGVKEVVAVRRDIKIKERLIRLLK